MRVASPLLYASIFLSGGAALVYEVVWSRQLSVFLGITLHAHALVLSSFMLGLALGSKVLGARADRSTAPLRFFGKLEGWIGIYGLASCLVVPALGKLYAKLARAWAPDGSDGPEAQLIRLVITAAALLAPTFLMGGTLPALVRSVRTVGIEPAATPRAIGFIYGVNTLGAAAGALAAGFWLIPGLGTIGALACAAAANLVVAAWAIATPRAGRTKEDLEAESGAHAAGASRTTGATGADPATAAIGAGGEAESIRPGPVLVALGLFGAAGLSIQLVWIQALTHVVGASVYALSLTLSAYLSGLAIGSSIFAWVAGKAEPRRLPRLGVALAFFASLAVLSSLVVFERLPEVLLTMFRAEPELKLATVLAAAVLCAWAMMLVPTILFGALTPLLVGLYSARTRDVGGKVGLALAANSAGTTLGALAAGFWILPTFGIQKTLIAGAGTLVACTWFILAAGMPRKTTALGRTRLAQAGVLGLAVLFALIVRAIPPWNPAVTTSGPFINASRLLDGPEGSAFSEWLEARNTIVYYREGAVGSVSVRDVADDRLLVINGKTDGSRLGDRRTQLALGHLPVLLHTNPSRVLVVGFGTGMTLAGAAAHSEVDRVDVIEISPEVIEASKYFAVENRGVLFDSKLRLHYADARNFLLTTPRRWDVIISEPSNPWISGIANLFTREYFELAAARLRPGGLMAQWFQGYGMSSDDLRSLTRTFQDVFPAVTIWSPQPGDLVLVGGGESYALDLDRLTVFAETPAGYQDLFTAGWTGPDSLLRTLVLDFEAAASYGLGAPLNTDNHPRVEFNAPKSLYLETTVSNTLDLLTHLNDEEVEVPIRTIEDEAGYRKHAFGISANEADLTPSVRLRWSALRSAQPSPLPNLAVSLRRNVELRTAGQTLQIEVLNEVGPVRRERLIERLSTLGGTPDDLSNGALADGTTAVRADYGASSELPHGLAWSCTGTEPRSYVVFGNAEAMAVAQHMLSCAEPIDLLRPASIPTIVDSADAV